MAYEPRDGSGSLFKNDKEGVENRPDYKGDIMIDGKMYWLSSWIKEGAKGKFMSLSAQPKDKQPQGQQQSQAPQPAANIADLDSDVPF